jgi:hypothetical protein
LKKHDIKNIGLGCIKSLANTKYRVVVYIANTPSMPEYQKCHYMQAMRKGEITDIGIVCGNGWRKVFNVYSKLLYALDADNFSFKTCGHSWQDYRDNFLLQQNSGTALLFSPPLLQNNTNCIHIISGKTYAKTLMESELLNASLIWLDESFAIDIKNRLLVCPYFDYRQLSNQKIERLALLIHELITSN